MERISVVWRGIGLICAGALVACAPRWADPAVRQAALTGPELGAELPVAPDSFTRAPGFKYSPRVAARDDGFLVSWLRSPISPPEDMGGVYATRVDLQGQVLDPQEIKVSTDSGSSHFSGEDTHAAVSANDRGYLLVHELPGALHSAVIDTGGHLVAHDVSVASTNAHNVGPRPELSWDGAHHLAVWQDGFPPAAMAIRLNSDGSPADPAPFQVSVPPVEGNFPQVAWTGSQHLVTWTDPPVGFDVRRVSPDGTLPDATQVHLPIATVGGNLAMCGPAGSSAVVSWTAGMVQATTLDAAATAGPVFSLTGSQAAYSAPTLGCSGSRVIAAYLSALQSFELRTAARDLSAGAAVTAGAVSATVGGRWAPSVGCGPSRCLLAWLSGPSSGLDVRGVVTDTAGAVLSSPETLIATDVARRSEPVVCWDGTRYLAIWVESSERFPSLDADIYGGWLDATGAPQAGRIAVAGGTGFRHASAVACGSQGALVAWIDDPDSTMTIDNLFHIRRIGADGTPGAAATPASPDTVSRQQNAVIAAGNDTFLVAWIGSGGLSAATVGASWNGEPLTPLTLTTQAPSNALSAIWDGENFLVAWVQGAAILGVRVRPGGSQVDPAPLTFASGKFDSVNLAAAAGTDRTMLLWMNTSVAGPTQTSMGGSVIDHAGQVLRNFQIPLASTDRPVSRLHLAWNGASYVASWLAIDPLGVLTAVRMIRLTPDGAAADPTSILVPDTVEPADPILAGDGNGHVLLLYSEINPNTTGGQTRVVSRRVTSGSLDGVGVDGGDAATTTDGSPGERSADSLSGADVADGVAPDRVAAVDGEAGTDGSRDDATSAQSGGCSCASAGHQRSGQGWGGLLPLTLAAAASRRKRRLKK